MAHEESQKPDEKARFNVCSQCGHKGLYHIRQQYYRCRYCGTYIISAADKETPEKLE